MNTCPRCERLMQLVVNPPIVPDSSDETIRDLQNKLRLARNRYQELSEEITQIKDAFALIGRLFNEHSL